MSKTGTRKNRIRGAFFEPEDMAVQALHQPRITPPMTTKTPRGIRFVPKTPAKTGTHHVSKNYCNKVPSSGCVFASSGGMKTAAATLS
jgi:hypothetical protein